MKIFITGVTKGIGKALAFKFAKQGFDIVGCARNQQELSALSNQLIKEYPTNKYNLFEMDVCDNKALELIESKVKNIDILANNAAYYLEAPLFSETQDQLKELIDTNFFAPYVLTKNLLPILKKSSNPHIINICSLAGHKTFEKGPAYAISKAAMLHFSRTLQEILKPQGIKVTSILPSATLTSSWDGEDVIENKFILPEDIASMAYTATQLSVGASVSEMRFDAKGF
ncbi:MAG: short-subunit dehydrogenase [Sphingobacteriales bacterium]|jgi:short-subunit dehydrogenase